MSDSTASEKKRMTVTVTLHAELRRYLPTGATGPVNVEIEPEAPVSEVLRKLNVPETAMITVGLNGELANRETKLSEGDVLTLFAPMEGG